MPDELTVKSFSEKFSIYDSVKKENEIKAFWSQLTNPKLPTEWQWCVSDGINMEVLIMS